jgi:poly-gamma-glutamate capsule biosynthesis protein CapA/YwtB (metallophosphatase superfamily)
VQTAGAGRNLSEAQRPAAVQVAGGAPAAAAAKGAAAGAGALAEPGEDTAPPRDAGGAAAAPGRVLVFGLGHASSGIPEAWAAGPAAPGVFSVDLTRADVARVGGLVAAAKRPSRDIVVASIHWGSNWGFDIPKAQRAFARALIDDGARAVGVGVGARVVGVLAPVAAGVAPQGLC